MAWKVDVAATVVLFVGVEKDAEELSPSPHADPHQVVLVRLLFRVSQRLGVGNSDSHHVVALAVGERSKRRGRYGRMGAADSFPSCGRAAIQQYRPKAQRAEIARALLAGGLY